jgi:class 3 adenylate cyclase/pimeloyl-ACP methyl ester carboxylesterase
VSDQASPQARYAHTTDGVRIAYTVHGGGAPLVYVRALNSHAELWWKEGWSSRFLGALAEAFTVVLFDARGNGLSDSRTSVDLDALLLDLDAVIHDADLRDVTLFGQGFGSPVAIAYAARSPERISRLLLYCAYATGAEVVITDRFIETMRSMPEAATAFMARETYPDDEDLPSRLFAMQSMHAHPGSAVAQFEYARTVDVFDDLQHVRVPTLVMQPERNPQVRMALGRQVAESIPGAEFHEIPGGAYNPYAPKSFEPTLRAIGDFVGVALTALSRPIVLMLTDMVDSTAMTQRLGESASRELHTLHDSLVVTELEAHNGTVTQHTGDGVMATFQSAADAMGCAVAIQRRLAERNRNAHERLEIRVGLAHGEVYAHDGRPFASSAQLVTRVASRGGAGDILATDPVYELVSGAGFEFGNARSVALKGFPGRVRLHDVRWTNEASR